MILGFCIGFVLGMIVGLFLVTIAQSGKSDND